MNYPPANVWHKASPEIERLVALEPELVRVNPGDWPPLSLPAEWPVERRTEFLSRWQEKSKVGSR